VLVTAAVAVLALGAAGRALAASSAAVGWGHNVHWQLGAGFSSSSESSPVTVRGVTNIASMAVGWEDAFALLSNGTLRGWGSDLYGQLGDGHQAVHSHEEDTSPTPVKNTEEAELTGVTNFATAGDHAVAVLESGKVATWGNSQDGTRGNGESGLIKEAREKHEAQPETYPYANRTLALEMQLKNPETSAEVAASEVAAASRTSYALVNGGREVYSWGGNGGGKLGIGLEPGGSHGEPYQPEACKLSESKVVEEVETAGLEAACSTTPWRVHLPAFEVAGSIAHVVAGEGAAYALLANGEIYAWGNGSNGAIGNGSTANSPTPTKVLVPACPETSAAEHCPAVAVSGGKNFAWALLANNEVVGWGQNDFGQLGSEDAELCKTTMCSTTPKRVIGPGLGTIEAISAGSELGGIALISGKVYSLGKNRYGLLGIGLAENVVRREPQPIEGLGTVNGIAAGENSDLAYMAEGAGPTPLVSVTPESKRLKITWTVKAPEESLRLKVIAVKGVPVEKGAESETVLRASGECSAEKPCTYTFSEVRHGEALSSENEYQIRFGVLKAEEFRNLRSIPLP
jgi:alpha-tubulin suppressor-like RCC1 family protein